MTKTILIFLAVATISFGQIEQGTYQLGGGFGFQTGSTGKGDSKTDITEWHISPQASFFLIDNFSVGLELAYRSSSSSSSISKEEMDRDLLYFGPIIQFFFPVNENVFSFLKASYSHSISDLSSKRELLYFDPTIGEPGYTLSQTKSSLSSDRYVIGGGLAMFMNEFVSIEPQVVFEMDRFVTKSELKSVIGSETHKIRFSNESNFLIFSVGVNYYIRKEIF
ncbi:MAG: hypothetical protein D8M58_14020 [Calditrichaeota bacterium]|nr:MAG: hypothetical protein DWQ03_15260 [Calditrichota bacterium]MBL1206516.1 hypothetical protein [Calditrichota bacterium]NOG46344.1 outer membrane beta-barrel protein [Calditrichota bacterium]